MLFDWITKNVKNAVMAGFNQAMAEISGLTKEQAPTVPEVRLLLGPVSEPEETSKGKRKAS